MLQIPEAVKSLFLQDGIRKNFRVHFPNGERADITNSDIETESVRFTESLCSQNELKFGLCESSTLEFTCYGIENIKGMLIEAQIEIDVSGLSDEEAEHHYSDDLNFPYFPIKYGKFKIDSCKRDAKGLGRRDVEAYSLMADDNWVMPRYMTDQLANQSWYTNNKVIVSPELFIKALFPEMFKDEITEASVQSSIGSSKWKQVGNPIIDPLGNVYKVEIRNTYGFKSSAINDSSKKTALQTILFKYIANDGIKAAIEQISELVGKKLKIPGAYVKYHYGNSSFLFREDTYPSSGLGSPTQIIITGPSAGVDMDETILYDGDAGAYLFNNEYYLSTNTNTSKKYYMHGSYDKTETSIWSSRSNIEVCPTCGVRLLKNDIEIYSYNDTLATVIKDVLFKAYTPETESVYLSQIERVAYKETVPKFTYKYTSSGLFSSKSETKVTRTAYRLSETDISALNIKEMIEAFYELQGKFGMFNRDGTFELRSLDKSALYPAETLYPSDTLYPLGSGEGINASTYTECWIDEEDSKPYDRVGLTYTDASGNDNYDYRDLIDTNAEGYNKDDYQSYTMGYNKLVQDCALTETTVGEILETVGEAIKGVKYTPYEVETVGMPWVEAGDPINIVTKDGTYRSYVLRRTLSGIQVLRDSYEAK